ncbi:DNA-binding winged helix-turn-helix (wHTH) protein [Clavibacter michiganensis]|uniref:winged helix-turn-helix domain-containing protein n=1 Tax=Clavibacter michiganensis TaxID=28447 RepID=UPI001AE75EE3|nr:winged helix-turn-helix domain-containing protein [Clavibacter michiganensis]MBP2457220.1 DNA-binding winged helix-turn-helix (wHTH) protein [Clavibacter michiganensis]MDQ0409790.1 DNA-binding winged helix-turn-helix (wHTH) protein [Clavibacter michiganensis]
MSLATIDPARTALRSTPAAPVLRAAAPLAPPARRPQAVPASASTTTAAPAAAPARPARLRAVPEGTEARGFAIYVGLDELKAAAAGTDLGTVVAALKRLAAELAPGVETHAAVALAPEGAGGRDIDVVRLALQDPAAVAQHREQPEDDERVDGGVTVDLSRKRVVLDGETAPLTYKEFELLQYLVLREGRTIERSELIASLWSAADEDDVPNERTIDVHVRRLRSKLGRYEEIVRTVRGAGYRFDRHADVAVNHASTQSPDLF